MVVNHGADQSFTITPDAGFHIADVLVDGGSVGAVASYTFTNVTAGHTISASFAGTQHTITASAGAGGAIDPTGAVLVNEGSDQLFTITPDAGFHIADVLVDGGTIGAAGTYNFKDVTADHTISASFAINTYTITASAGAGGSIDPSGAVVVNQGADQSFTITPTAGFAIADVLVDGGSVGAVGTYTFTNVIADHTISASFSANTFTITASAGAGGAIAPSGAVVVAEGNDQSFTITPDTGFHIADVLVDGSSVGAVGSYTFTNVTADHTIHATFAINTYTITASAGPNGSIAPNGAVVVNHGADQSFTITADATYHVADVVVDGSSVGAVGTYTFTNVTADHTIHATFAINTYTITASAGAGGSIAPSGAVIVNHGADQSFTITPDANFNIADVLVDGSSVGAVGTYTFTNVTADHTIAASFVATNFTLNVTVVGNGTVTKNPDLPTYTAGSVVQLTAAAATGFHFAGWSGDASGITNPLSVTMDSNKNITATFLANVYAWNQTGSAAWTTGTNWTPTRFASSTTDVLMFNNGATTTATGVPAQNVAQLFISGNTNVTLTVSGAAILNLLGGTGDDFTVEAGSTLSLNGAASFSIGLGTGTTGTVGGRINATTAGQTITAQGTNSLVFTSGSLVSCGASFTGNLFGTTNLTTVLFQSGAVYAQTAGSNPFGAAQPQSVCTFAPGSRYRLEGTIIPSFSGRTYADFEKASAGATSTTGGAPLKIDNMFITQGTMNCGMTGQFDLKGDIVVSTGAALNFLPASGTPAVTFSGSTAQTITVNGTMSIGTNEAFDIVNPSGVSIATDVTLAGRLGFGTGVLHTGSHILAVVGASSSITGASAASGWVDGNLRRTLTPTAGTASRTFDVGDATHYTPVAVVAHGVGAAFDLTGKTAGADHADIANSGINAGATANRTWTLTPVGSPAFTNYDATFNFTASDLDAGANTNNFVVRRFDGTWHPTTTGARTATSTQATGITSFSDFQVGELNLYTLNVTVMGAGNVTRSPVQASYASGTVVTLTAAAAPGWAFQGWSGDITSAVNPLAVTMTHNTNLIATFTDILSPTVSVDSPNGGETLLVGYMRTITWTAQDNATVTAVDLYVSRDGGTTYPELIATGLPNTGTYNWIATPPGTVDADDSFTCFIRAVAHDASGNTAHDESDAGFEIVEIAPTAVAANLPKEFGLSNAWPNPGTRTTIEYAMPREANVKLSIVDIQGREIAVLADGVQPAGRHQVKWDGRTDAGMASSGVYFMRFAAPGRTVVKRFSLAH